MSFSSSEIASLFIRQNEPLGAKTTLRSGGHARWYAEAKSSADAARLLDAAASKNIRVLILGRGSNLIVTDGVLDALVIRPLMSDIYIEENNFTAGAALTWAAAMQGAQKNNLCGLEIGTGIPGTMGGAVKMNAGTSLGDAASCLTSITLAQAGKVHTVNAKDLQLSYRHSNLNESQLVCSCTFNLKKTGEDSLAQVRIESQKYLEKRSASQPLTQPTFGSTWKNPPGRHAGQIIEECGLKGFTTGGMMISEKHANFIINCGRGTSSDALALMQHVEDTVGGRLGLKLEREVVIWK